MNNFALDRNYDQINFEEISVAELEVISGGSGGLGGSWPTPIPPTWPTYPFWPTGIPPYFPPSDPITYPGGGGGGGVWG